MLAGQSRLIPHDDARSHRNNFDFIRLMMALAVIYSHSYALYIGSEDTETLSRLTNGFYNSGNIGVWVFFIISGFLVTQSFERSSIGGYAEKRIRRIYPGYMVATTICAFVVTPLFVADGAFRLTLTEIARTIGLNLVFTNHFPIDELFVHNHGKGINGALWSIKYEMLCYVGVAALGLIGLLRRRMAILFLYGIVILLWCWCDATGRKPGGGHFFLVVFGWPYLWFRVLPNFLMGMIIYLYRDRIVRSIPLLVAGALACFAAFYLPDRWLGTQLAHLIVPPTLAYGVFIFAYHPNIALQQAARFGDFSYGTYLYGFVIQQMLLASFRMEFWWFVIASMLCSLLAGVASWFLVERHFLRRKPRRPAINPASSGSSAVRGV